MTSTHAVLALRSAVASCMLALARKARLRGLPLPVPAIVAAEVDADTKLARLESGATATCGAHAPLTASAEAIAGRDPLAALGPGGSTPVAASAVPIVGEPSRAASPAPPAAVPPQEGACGEGVTAPVASDSPAPAVAEAVAEANGGDAPPSGAPAEPAPVAALVGSHEGPSTPAPSPELASSQPVADTATAATQPSAAASSPTPTSTATSVPGPTAVAAAVQSAPARAASPTESKTSADPSASGRRKYTSEVRRRPARRRRAQCVDWARGREHRRRTMAWTGSWKRCWRSTGSLR